jgi:hypothetical protein
VTSRARGQRPQFDYERCPQLPQTNILQSPDILFPDGYTDAVSEPRHPRCHAELMGGRIPVAPGQAESPASLQVTRSGPAAAARLRRTRTGGQIAVAGSPAHRTACHARAGHATMILDTRGSLWRRHPEQVRIVNTAITDVDFDLRHPPALQHAAVARPTQQRGIR